MRGPPPRRASGLPKLPRRGLLWVLGGFPVPDGGVSVPTLPTGGVSFDAAGSRSYSDGGRYLYPRNDNRTCRLRFETFVSTKLR